MIKGLAVELTATVIKELTVARSEGAEGCYGVLDESESVDLPMLDDFPAAPISAQSAIDLLGIIEAREGLHSTAVASQLGPEEWYVRAEGETMADSIPGRLASRRPHLDTDGPNMRERVAEKEDKQEDARQTLGTSEMTVPLPPNAGTHVPTAGTDRSYCRYRIPTVGTDSHHQRYLGRYRWHRLPLPLVPPRRPLVPHALPSVPIFARSGTVFH